MIQLDLEMYFRVVGIICISLAGFWGFRRIKSLFNRT